MISRQPAGYFAQLLTASNESETNNSKRKLQTRNPKHEARNKSECPKQKELHNCPLVFVLNIWKFGF